MLFSNNKKVKGLILLFLVALIPTIYTLFPNTLTKKTTDAADGRSNRDIEVKLSLPPTSYDWWNNSWDFRIPLGIEAVGAQVDAPVELYINFTKYFQDLNIQNPTLNTSTIRVIEYTSSSDYYEIESQFDPYSRSYDSQTNAIGDLIWILNGTTLNNQIREFFVYFNNGSTPRVPDPNYDTIRLWHEGFEEYRSGDILRPSGTQDNPSQIDYWEINNDTLARGQSCLHVWGNNWKASATGPITITPAMTVTAKMRFDDPSILREISGIGFRGDLTNIPDSQNSYRIRGNQNWGSAGSNKFVNQYYATNTFFWYTFNLDTEIALSSFNYIFYIADDDSFSPNIDLYWDDISIWAKTVQTTPNNSLQTTIGEIQPIEYTLKITCKDEDGSRVPNAHIYLTNDLTPSYNQDHISDENGEWTFEGIEKDALYNITVNYTQNGLISPQSATVFYYENFPIITLNNHLTAYLSLMKLNFNVTDKDNDPIQNGYILLKEGVNTVGKTILDEFGTGSITWINNTAYDYEVYYDYDSLTDNSNYREPNLEIFSASVGSIKNIDVLTEISKIIFNVTDDTAQLVPFTNAKLRFYNQTDYDNENKIIANVSVDINGIAQFISFSNTYGNWGNYTVDIYFGGFEQDFHTNLGPLEHEYNFTLVTQDYAKIEIPLNKDIYNSTITNLEYSSDIYWGDNGYIYFNFIKQDPLVPTPTVVAPNEIYLQMFDEELTQYGPRVDIISYMISPGVFNFTFNSADFDFIGGSTYYFNIIGNYKSYVFNEIAYNSLNVNPIETDITYYDYSLNELTDKRVTVVYGEIVNIVADFHELSSGIPLNGALISYSWDYGSGMFIDDPIHPDLYYIEFDSTPAPSTAEYIINILAILTNYSTISDSIIVSILPRPTSINDETGLFQDFPDVYVLKTKLFYFEYKDILSSTILGDLDIATYNWYRIGEDGKPLSGPGNEGSGDLTQAVNGSYILDFDTELREVGEYSIYITLQKNNHEVRNALLSLTISKRPIDVVFQATGLTGDQISIIQGNPITFTITLTDPTESDQPLTGATVYLAISEGNFTLTEVIGNPGTYVYTYSTNHINTFLAPKTFTGQIIIHKDNYEVDPLSVTIVIEMTEIFPGFPMFYFLLIVGAVVAVVASLAIYRTIQQARIPKFVKKVRKMKKEIKSKKSISDSVLYPSKEEYLVKRLGDKWESLGISLTKVLGVEAKKKKQVKEELSEYKTTQGGEL
ncbi:MAG: hypothetical protein ACFFBI_02005 [Promethearchaeota archaeon]